MSLSSGTNERAPLESAVARSRSPAAETCASEWDELVVQSPDGHHEQTSGYALERAAHGFTSFRVCAHEGARLVAGAQVLVRELPVIGKLGTVQQGPLFVRRDEALTARFVRQLFDETRARGVRRLRVQSYAASALVGPCLRTAGFEPADAWWQAEETCLMPVQRSDEAMLAAMSQSGRRGIRQAERAGVEVREVGREGIPALHALLCATAAHQRFPVFPRAYFEYLWALFAPHRKLSILLAYLRGEPIAGILVTFSGTRGYYGWGGMSRDEQHVNARANYALHWSAMRLSRERGAEHYDLSGNSDFKQKLAPVRTLYPAPFDCYMGPFANIMRQSFRHSFREPRVRRVLEGLGRRMYEPLPY